MVINMDVQDNGNILVEEENTIYEIDGKCKDVLRGSSTRGYSCI